MRNSCNCIGIDVMKRNSTVPEITLTQLRDVGIRNVLRFVHIGGPGNLDCTFQRGCGRTFLLMLFEQPINGRPGSGRDRQVVVHVDAGEDGQLIACFVVAGHIGTNLVTLQLYPASFQPAI